jgi:hypothetical protein
MLGTNGLLSGGNLTKHGSTGIVSARAIGAPDATLLGTAVLALPDVSAARLRAFVLQAGLALRFLDRGGDAMMVGFPKRRFGGRVVRIADQPQPGLEALSSGRSASARSG